MKIKKIREILNQLDSKYDDYELIGNTGVDTLSIVELCNLQSVDESVKSLDIVFEKTPGITVLLNLRELTITEKGNLETRFLKEELYDILQTALSKFGFRAGYDMVVHSEPTSNRFICRTCTVVTRIDSQSGKKVCCGEVPSPEELGT